MTRILRDVTTHHRCPGSSDIFTMASLGPASKRHCTGERFPDPFDMDECSTSEVFVVPFL